MDADSNLDRALRAVADPTRRRILQALKERRHSSAPVASTAVDKVAKTWSQEAACLCAGDIQHRIQLSQPTISHHMAILAKAGLIEAVKQGQWRWYRRNERAIRKLVKMLRAKL